MAFCPNCGAQISDKAVFCVKCGVGVTPKSAQAAVANDDAAIRLLIPIGRSGWALAAGYLGLLSLIPFLGVFAILIGIIAVFDIKKHPDKHGLGRAWFGIVMGILTVIAYTIGFFYSCTAL